MIKKVLSWDCETSIGTTVHGSTFRDPRNDIYTQIFASHPSNVEVIHDPKGFGRVCKVWLGDVDLLIGHNISFDLCYVWKDPDIQKYFIDGGKIWDTQLAEYLLTGQQHAFASLAELQEKYLGRREKPSKISFLYKKGIGADRIVQKGKKCPRLWALYNEYCRSDGATPLLIFKAQYSRAKEEGMLALIEMYNDYLISIINMTCTGIKIDITKTEKTLQQFNLKHLEYLEQAQNILKSVWTDPRLPKFNINSPDHKSAVFFGGSIKIKETIEAGKFKNGNTRYKSIDSAILVRGYGVSPTLSYRGKKEGLYSTDDKVMKKIALNTTNNEIKEYIKLQKQAMMYKKAAKTYCQALLDRTIDGYLYPNFNNTITPTGRLSSSEPNTQNIPSKGELATPIMGLLVAPDGYKCVTIDFSQLEKWMQAYASKDENLTSNLLKGICMHCVTLAAMTNKPYEWVYQKAKVEQDPDWDKRRTNIKPVGFLMDYGGMQERVAEETGLPKDQVDEIFRIDRELYPQKYVFFEKLLPDIVKNSSQLSRERDIPASRKKGKDSCRFIKGIELLPIFDSSGNVGYNESEFRKVGWYKTNYGKKYHFLENGRYSKQGLRRGFSMPKFKNYPNQGGGGDIQGATSAELNKALLTKADKIRMINEIHDSKMLYIREDVLEPCLLWLKNTIENIPAIWKRRFNLEFPFKIPVEIKVGDNFGEMVKYEFNNEETLNVNKVHDSNNNPASL